MTAVNTDKLLKVVANTGWQVGASGVGDGAVETIPLVSATGLPTDTAVLVTIDRVDSSGNKTPSKMERVIGVVNGNNLVNCIRGVEGTAQAHTGGAVVEVVISASNINKLMEHLLTEHNQDGSHFDANDSQKGVVELATNEETKDGSDDTKAVTPAGLKAVTDSKCADKTVFFHQAFPGGLLGFSTSNLTDTLIETTRFGYLTTMFFHNIPAGKKLYVKIGFRLNMTSGQTFSVMLKDGAFTMPYFTVTGTGANADYASDWIEANNVADGLASWAMYAKVSGGTAVGQNKLAILFAWGD